MSGDKRSVATDALEILGSLITDKRVGRDAIHLACEPVVTGEPVTPGMDVGRLPNGTFGPSGLPHLGIVDPFLPKNKAIPVGSELLLVVYPRQITSLRHVWSHPNFPEAAGDAPNNNAEISSRVIVVGAPNQAEDGRLWGRVMLQRFIDEHVAPYNDGYKPFDVDELIEAIDTGEGLSSGAAMIYNEHNEELKTYFKAAMGRDPREDGFYFSCAC